MKLLNGCAKSKFIADAFERMGYESWTCDLLPAEGEGRHIQDDVLNHLNDGWDMAIFHPPCTYLSWAGTRHWNNDGRYKLRLEAIDFFMAFVEAPIEKICIENPLGIMSQVYRPPDQTIHPYYFGDADMKRTCLWLKNLPTLTYHLQDDLFGQRTAVDKPEPISIDNTATKQKRYFTDSKIRDGEIRSRTFLSIANAMAKQWG